MKETSLYIRVFSFQIDSQTSGTVIEMTDEAFNRIPLCPGQIAVGILYLFQVRYISKQLLCIHEILIDIIEISENHITPEHKFINCLCSRIKSSIAVIKIKQEPQPVCRIPVGHRIEQVIDCGHHRHDQWSCKRICRNIVSKMLPEEYHGTTVRKYKAFPLYPPGLIVMVCDLFKKWRHSFTFAFMQR